MPRKSCPAAGVSNSYHRSMGNALFTISGLVSVRRKSYRPTFEPHASPGRHRPGPPSANASCAHHGDTSCKNLHPQAPPSALGQISHDPCSLLALATAGWPPSAHPVPALAAPDPSGALATDKLAHFLVFGLLATSSASPVASNSVGAAHWLPHALSPAAA